MPKPQPGNGIRIDHSTFNQVQGDLNHYQIAGDLHTHDGEHGEWTFCTAALSSILKLRQVYLH